ncbi:MAG: F0F1 ATP synthase subunit delta [Aestuariivita sp.]|nr:F0F1 ATP synthase subunit delta [Aestuariivita sp.]
MSEPASISASISERYATAVFEIAMEHDDLDGLADNLGIVEDAIAISSDLRDVIASPVLSRSEQGNVMAELALRLSLSDTVRNLLLLMADKRRLFVLPHLFQSVRAKIADHRGEVSAEVRTAHALTPSQIDTLSAVLKAKFDRSIVMDVVVDKSLVGGLVVQVGSKMIDTSIAAKLSTLQNIMKEVDEI